MYEIMEQ
jgi:hypothetical protein